MSQISNYFNAGVIPPGTFVETLTGNTGGPVGPDGTGTINVIGSGNINVAGNAGTNTETITITGVIPIANGGTNSASYSTVDGTIYYDGTRLITTATGTSGQVLTSGGAGVPPAYATLPTSVASITAGLNIAITGTATVPIVSSSQDQYLTNYRVANATPFVVNATDFYITVDTSTTAITIQLPDAPTIYRRFVIKDSAGNAAAQNVTVTTVSGVKLIDGATTFVMNTNYEAIELVYDNFGYQVF